MYNSHLIRQNVGSLSPYTEEKLEFITKFNFKFPDVTYTECITLCNLLLKQKTYYDTRKTVFAKLQYHFVIKKNFLRNFKSTTFLDKLVLPHKTNLFTVLHFKLFIIKP